MANTGLLVVAWPLVMGVDASGVVVEASPEAEGEYNLRPGTYVCGCTRLGMKEYATGQEYFLMDAIATIPKPSNIDLKQAATLGVGIESAAFAVFEGLNVDLMDPENLPKEREGEWAIVLGGASSVGWYAVQLLRAAGYKVLASCSKKSADNIKSLGAEPLDYSLPLADQLQHVLAVTGGNIVGIFDAVAANDPILAKELFKSPQYLSGRKYFSTTNGWAQIPDFEGGKTYILKLGVVGRPDATELNNTLKKYIPVLVKLVENGAVRPNNYEVVGQGGFESLVEGYKLKSGGGGGSKKVIVKIQDE